ncbi:MauE/DoxX family redox-associated membrane protein [Streptomyces sp. NPDC127074]|uniref:MauE/DoxX family redox-associated membrane protein n=1 Tax=Streptomyces sp. NPDC127074 TaxID=3347130 RepID=UPI00365A11BC
MDYVIEGCRIFLGLVFLCSAISKLRSPAAFRSFRRAVGRLAPPLRRRTGPVAVLLVMAEAAVITALAIPATIPAGFALALALLVAFTTGLVGVLRRKVSAPCHCFGGRGAPVAPRHVVRNAVLIAVALTGLGVWPAVPDETGSPAGLLLAAGVAALLAMITVTLDDLAGLFAPPDAGATR